MMTDQDITMFVQDIMLTTQGITILFYDVTMFDKYIMITTKDITRSDKDMIMTAQGITMFDQDIMMTQPNNIRHTQGNKKVALFNDVCLLYNGIKTKFLNGKISFIKRYLPHYNLCYMPLPPFQK